MSSKGGNHLQSEWFHRPYGPTLEGEEKGKGRRVDYYPHLSHERVGKMTVYGLMCTPLTAESCCSPSSRCPDLNLHSPFRHFSHFAIVTSLSRAFPRAQNNQAEDTFHRTLNCLGNSPFSCRFFLRHREPWTEAHQCRLFLSGYSALARSHTPICPWCFICHHQSSSHFL